MVDPERPLPSGWLPPKAPAQHTPPSAPPAPGPAWPREPSKPTEPSSPAAVFAISLGVASILLTALSLGLAFFGSIVLSAIALMIAGRLRQAIRAGRPGRESQARAGMIVAWIGLGLGIVAGVVWIVLAASGVTPQEVQEMLEREVERQRNRG